MKAKFGGTALAGLLLLSSAALADPFKLHIACTATGDCASAMVARDEGIFAKNGLDVDMTLIGINTNIPPAIASHSIDIGGPTAPVFLQATDGGLRIPAQLDLVAHRGLDRHRPMLRPVPIDPSGGGLGARRAPFPSSRRP